MMIKRLRNIFSAAVAQSALFLVPTPITHAHENHPDLEAEVSGMRECFNLNSARHAQPEPVQNLLQVIDDIQQISADLTNRLIENARQNNTEICFADLRTSNALWDAYNSRVVLKSYEAEDYRLGRIVSSLFHELQHSIQHQNGQISYDPLWSPRERQYQLLAIEATAKTIQYLSAFELLLEGYDYIWYDLQGTDLQIMMAIVSSYDRAFLDEENPKTHEQSMRLAATEAIRAIYENEEWLDAYNRRVLNTYIHDVQLNRVRSDSPYRRMTPWDVSLLNESGRIDDSGNVFEDTNDITDDFFAGNIAYELIFDYLEIFHARQLHGTHSPEYRRAYAENNGASNRYMNVDLMRMNPYSISMAAEFECQLEGSLCVTDERTRERTVIDPAPSPRR